MNYFIFIFVVFFYKNLNLNTISRIMTKGEIVLFLKIYKNTSSLYNKQISLNNIIEIYIKKIN